MFWEDLEFFFSQATSISMSKWPMSVRVRIYKVKTGVGVLTANNGVVLHDFKMLTNNDIAATSSGHEYLAQRSSLFHGGDLIARDGSLKGIDGIDFSDEHPSTHAVKSLSTPFANITKSGNNCDFSSNHDISSAFDAVDQRFSASVEVVELRLCNGVVDVDAWGQELILFQPLVEVVDAGRGLFRDPVAVLEHFGVFVVDKTGQISSIIQDQVKLLAVLESEELLFQTPVVLFLSFAFPCESSPISLMRP